MHIGTRRGALRAAAKLVITFGALGCGGNTVDTGSDVDPATSASSSSSSAAASGASSASAASGAASSGASSTGMIDMDASAPECGVTVPVGNVSDETFQCCLQSVASEVAMMASLSPAPPCCDAIVEKIAADTMNYSAASEAGVLGPCCMALGNPVGPACTPWGPPVPPEMPAEVA